VEELNIGLASVEIITGLIYKTVCARWVWHYVMLEISHVVKTFKLRCRNGFCEWPKESFTDRFETLVQNWWNCFGLGTLHGKRRIKKKIQIVSNMLCFVSL